MIGRQSLINEYFRELNTHNSMRAEVKVKVMPNLSPRIFKRHFRIRAFSHSSKPTHRKSSVCSRGIKHTNEHVKIYISVDKAKNNLISMNSIITNINDVSKGLAV